MLESLCAASLQASGSPNIPSTCSQLRPGSGLLSHRQSSCRVLTIATKGRLPSVSAKADGSILSEGWASSDTQIYPRSYLPPIDPTTSTGTPCIDPSAATRRRSPSVDPPAPTTRSTPSVDPNPSVGLWRICKPSTAKSHRRDCRTRPFADTPEKQAPV